MKKLLIVLAVVFLLVMLVGCKNLPTRPTRANAEVISVNCTVAQVEFFYTARTVNAINSFPQLKAGDWVIVVADVGVIETYKITEIVK